MEVTENRGLANNHETTDNELKTRKLERPAEASVNNQGEGSSKNGSGQQSNNNKNTKEKMEASNRKSQTEKLQRKEEQVKPRNKIDLDEGNENRARSSNKETKPKQQHSSLERRGSSSSKTRTRNSSLGRICYYGSDDSESGAMEGVESRGGKRDRDNSPSPSTTAKKQHVNRPNTTRSSQPIRVLDSSSSNSSQNLPSSCPGRGRGINTWSTHKS